MTSPGGSSGITAPVDSVSSTGASSLETNTQTNVVNRKKAEVRASPGWNSASGTFFDKLMGGFVNGILGLISSLFGGIFGGGSGGGLLDLIGGFLGVKEDVNNVVNVEVPRLDNRIDEVTVGGVSAKRSFFGNDGTWVRPEGGPWSRHVVDVIGGGSGGGRANYRYTLSNGTQATVRAGDGGYVGGWNSAEFFDSDLPASVPVTVGSGGAGSTVNGSPGSSGGQTNFGSFISAGGATPTANGFGVKTIPLRGGHGGFAYDNGFGSTFPNEPTAGTGHAYGNGGIAAVPRNSGLPGGNGNSPSPSTLAYPGTGGGGGAEEGTVGDPGGNGGNGGYPGGPGGGGGQGGPFNGPNGNGGNAAAGACWVTSYK